MATGEMKIVIGFLKDASAKFRDLKREAGICLRQKRDSDGYKERLRERGRLLIDLEENLIIPLSAMKGAELDLAYEIRMQVARFAGSAAEALEENDNFALGVLLTHMGCKTGEENDLEKLIEYLEKKY